MKSDGIYARSKYHLGWHLTGLTSHSTLCGLPACAERSEPAMCVYESYISQTGMMTQLNKFDGQSTRLGERTQRNDSHDVHEL